MQQFPYIDVAELFLPPDQLFHNEPAHYVKSSIVFVPEVMPPAVFDPPEDVFFVEPQEEEPHNMPSSSPERQWGPSSSSEPESAAEPEGAEPESESAHPWNADGSYVGIDEGNILGGRTRRQQQKEEYKPTLGERLKAMELSGRQA